MNRLIIYPKDVQLITGKTESSAYRLLNKIKKYLNKEAHQPLSIFDFCTYMGLNPSQVMQMLLA